MKNLIFIFVCLFTFQTYAQEGMKTTNTQGTQKLPDVAEAQVGNQKEITLEKTCSLEGYKITVTKDVDYYGNDVDNKRYISVDGIRKSYYATSSELENLPGFIGLPNSPNDTRLFDYGLPEDYLEVKMVAGAQPKQYCNQDGYYIIQTPVYHVTAGMSNQEWNGTVEITDGTHLDGAFLSFLVQTYNNRRLQENPSAALVPITCKEECYQVVDDGGVDHGDDGVKNPWDYIDAAGEVHSWFEDGDDNGSPIGGNGGIIYENVSVLLGATYNPLGGNLGDVGEVDLGFGGSVGLYVPITKKRPISVGAQVNYTYTEGEPQTTHKDAATDVALQYPVGDILSTVRYSEDSGFNQSMSMIGFGPQINFSVGKNISLNAIVQGTFTTFKKDGFTIIQEFEEGDLKIPVEIYNQKKIKSSSLFWTPKVRINYAVSSRIGLWLEGNYSIGKVDVTQSHLDVGEPMGKEGNYLFTQIYNAELVEQTSSSDIKGMGVALGILLRL